MSRATENRASAIFHQHEVCDINRQFPVLIERMLNLDACVETFFLSRFKRCNGGSGAAAFICKLRQIGIGFGKLLSQRMISGDRHERCAKQRIWTSRVDFHFRKILWRGLAVEREANLQAFRLADPVLLHDANFFRPLVKRVETGQQFLAEIGDLEEPLRQFALFDQRTRTPAATIHNLLIGKHGVVDRVPVNLGGLARHQTFFKQIDEQHLLALIIFNIAGRKLARPVERQTHRFQLTLHRGDVLIGPFFRMHVVLHRRVFRRHTKGVPSHWMKHVEALGALVASDHVTHRIVAHMAHVNAPRWIGEHLEHVIFFAAVAVVCLESLVFFPDFLPMCFRHARIITFGCHERIYSYEGDAIRRVDI